MSRSILLALRRIAPIVLLGGLLGCGRAIASTGAPAAGQRPVGVAVRRDAPDLLERVNFGGLSADELDASMRTGITDCMAARGWSFTSKGFVRPPSDRTLGQPPAPPSADHAYGLDLQLAELDGPQQPRPFGEDYAATLPDSSAAKFRLDLFGAPGGEDEPTTTGCLHTVEASTMKNVAVFNGYVDRVLAKMQAGIRSDPALASSTKAWDACMKESGFAVRSDREAAITDLAKRLPPILNNGAAPDAKKQQMAALLADERRTASADLACSKKTGYDDALATTYKAQALAAAEELGYLS